MVLISFYIECRIKGGAFICKSNYCCGAYSRATFIRVAVRNRSVTVTTLLLGKKEKMKDLFVTWEENLDFMGPFVSNS